MLKYTLSALFVLMSTISCFSDEYCYDQYKDKITQVNAELGTLLGEQQKIDNRVRDLFNLILEKSQELVVVSQKDPPDNQAIRSIGAQIAAYSKEKSDLQTKSFSIQDRIVALKGSIPADLAGHLRGCIEASKPADQFVNGTIQLLAILSTGGASMSLPPKALYVDMAAVLNGYPLGGPHSAVNEARSQAFKAFGMGESNDIRKTLENPVEALKKCFGLCK